MKQPIIGRVYRAPQSGMIVEAIERVVQIEGNFNGRVLFPGRLSGFHKVGDELPTLNAEAFKEVGESRAAYPQQLGLQLLGWAHGRTAMTLTAGPLPSIPDVRTERRDLMKRATDLWGHEAQVLVAIEEMAELTHALMRTIRQGWTQRTVAHVIAELADVCLMVDQMTFLFDGQVERGLGAEIDKKWKSLVERINAVGGAS